MDTPDFQTMCSPSTLADVTLPRRMLVQSDVLDVMKKHDVDPLSAELLLLELCRDGARNRPLLWSLLNHAIDEAIGGY